jgi:hypothetical protein
MLKMAKTLFSDSFRPLPWIQRIAENHSGYALLMRVLSRTTLNMMNPILKGQKIEYFHAYTAHELCHNKLVFEKNVSWSKSCFGDFGVIGMPKAKSSQFKVVANTIFLDFVRKEPVMPMKKLKEELTKKKKGPKINSRNTQLLIGD